MPDLLLELFCEEIPARMQRPAADHLQKKITDGLVAAGLTYEGAKAFWTPRRLTLTVHGIPLRSPDLKEERKGPKVGAPEKAVQGFLRGAGLTSLEEAKIQSDPKKGAYYLAIVEKPGQMALDILAELISSTIRSFAWPKSMRWGDTLAEKEALRWVRPLISILATFGPETEEVDIVPVSLPGFTASNQTKGHRFHAPGAFPVSRLEDYAAKLEAASVILDPERRQNIIRHDMKDQAFALGLEVVEDAALLEEVTGLVEFPVVLIGTFDERFLALPDEVIRLTIRENQKCFVLRDPKTGRLANRFVLTANIAARDGGAAIIAGNERVVRARLSDAAFFVETDTQTVLETCLEKLKAVVFHEKLGSYYERVGRLIALSGELCAATGAPPEQAKRAALLAKADLATSMVGEFPELQGYMGGMYARAQGETAAVAEAIGLHYKPLGPQDDVPSQPVAITVALADKLDLLAGFWAINEKPTGSKDPYALRRAALGVIRLVLHHELRLALREPIAAALARLSKAAGLSPDEADLASSLLAFFVDRLKVQLRDQGVRHDLVDAVFALAGQDDLVLATRRIEALGVFLASDDGENLLASYKRAANILRAEEKKDGERHDSAVQEALLLEPAEKGLFDALAKVNETVHGAVADEDFQAAMTALASLRAPVDAFFDTILVNADDAELRLNRLNLLSALSRTMGLVADFSQLQA